MKINAMTYIGMRMTAVSGHPNAIRAVFLEPSKLLYYVEIDGKATQVRIIRKK